MAQPKRYQIVRELGRGGMGVVSLGFDTVLKREVAIKSVLKPHGETQQSWQETVQRLIREAQAAGSLRHPNIVAVYDVVSDEFSPSIIMEFVQGKSLSELYSGEPVEFDVAIQVLKQCASALDHAHSRGIIHRDIKPSNIMVDDSGSVRITDFGVAKLLSSNTDLTHGLAIGTLEYMSPEQLTAGTVTSHTDQYSLAVVAYRLLTGSKRFEAETMGSWCAKVLAEAPIPPSSRNPRLAPGVDRVFSRALAKVPAERFGSCSQFVAELEHFLLAPGAGRPQTYLTEPPIEAKQTFAAESKPRRGLPDWVIGVSIGAIGAAAIASLVIFFSTSASKKLAVAIPPVATSATTAAAVTSPPRIEHPPEAPATGQTWKNPRDGEEYVFIAPAVFTMGCVPDDKSCDEDEAPHEVHLDHGYWIGKTEVTVEAFKSFADVTHTTMPPTPDFNPSWSLLTHPIVNVTWPEAKAYCEWMGGRLLTEAEWEYAARGGKAGQKYVSGNTISPADANYNGKDSFEFTAPVGSFPPNGFGLLDVSGNAAEWVDATEGSSKLVRGGSWNVYPESLRLSKRVLAEPERRNFTFGVRCAM